MFTLTPDNKIPFRDTKPASSTQQLFEMQKSVGNEVVTVPSPRYRLLRIEFQLWLNPPSASSFFWGLCFVSSAPRLQC